MEIVSAGADETTDVSLVGKFPDTAVPFGFTLGLVAPEGAVVVDETTDASSVAKCAPALAAGDGDAAAVTGDASDLAMTKARFHSFWQLAGLSLVASTPSLSRSALELAGANLRHPAKQPG